MSKTMNRRPCRSQRPPMVSQVHPSARPYFWKRVRKASKQERSTSARKRLRLDRCGRIVASKQSHEGRLKGGYTRKEGSSRPFSTDRIADQHREKIDGLIASTSPTHLLLKSIEQAVGLEMLSDDHDFC